MSQKRLVTLILSIGIFLSLAATVFAAGQPRRYNENSTVKGTISQSFYQVNAKTDVAVKSIAVTGTLYEKGTFGTWQKVSSCSNTSTSSSCSASNNYNTKPGKSYRLDCSATFTYSNRLFLTRCFRVCLRTVTRSQCPLLPMKCYSPMITATTRIATIKLSKNTSQPVL